MITLSQSGVIPPLAKMHEPLLRESWLHASDKCAKQLALLGRLSEEEKDIWFTARCPISFRGKKVCRAYSLSPILCPCTACQVDRRHLGTLRRG